MAFADPGQWSWTPFVETDRRIVLSLGLPVGLDECEPVRILEQLRSDGGRIADVVPPFGLVAVDKDSDTVEVFADWLGMVRLFEHCRSDGAFWTNRPTSLEATTGHCVGLDLEAWRSFVHAGHFVERSSPLRGVELLEPGARRFVRPLAASLQFASTTSTNVDTIVQEAVNGPVLDARSAAEAIGSGLRRVADSIYRQLDGPVSVGLSGGKDSRVIAAVLSRAELDVDFYTIADDVLEYETAKHLLDLRTKTTGRAFEHRAVHRVAASSDDVAPLLVRTKSFVEAHDYQGPSNYIGFPSPTAVGERTKVAIAGAAGELISGHWHPNDGPPITKTLLLEAFVKRLGTGVPATMQSPEVRNTGRQMAERLLDKVDRLGLSDDWSSMDYAFLFEKLRRWSNAAYDVGVVAPFLCREFVGATFSLPAALKRDRAIHGELISMYAPEWGEVPYVRNNSGPRKVASVRDGDGARVLGALLSEPTGVLSETMDVGALGAALVRPPGVHEAALSRFAVLKYADGALGDGEITEAWKGVAVGSGPSRTPEVDGASGHRHKVNRARRAFWKVVPHQVRERGRRVLSERRLPRRTS